MRYYVVADDGNRYGPADEQVLNDWIAQNRLLPHQMLEEEVSGMRIAASTLPGLRFSIVNPNAGAPNFQGYYRPPATDGSRDVTPAWILFAVGVLCSCSSPFGIILAIIGIVLANQGRKRGHPQASAAFAANVVLLIVCVATNWFGNFGGLLRMLMGGS